MANAAYIGKDIGKEPKRMILRVRILQRIHLGRTYSYEIVKEFSKSGLASFIGPTLKNDIYNTISMLEKNGYIKAKGTVEHGRAKKYFTLTSKGAATLRAAKKAFNAFAVQMGELWK